jgi:shikimate kinase
MPRHLVVVGLPGSGKSTVGQQVAEALGAPLFDIDSLLVREMGMPVEQIFGMVGEARFREMEHKAVLAAVAAEEPAVIVPGGGWAAQPGHMHQAREFALLIYLQCRPGTASKRTEHGEVRPLLVGGDPVENMRRLLDAREPFYKLADFEVAAERESDLVAAAVVELARAHGGWPVSS